MDHDPRPRRGISPSDFRVNEACRVDQKHPNTVDPLGGSYYVEALTNELEDKGRKWYEKVEAMGGSIQAIASGFYLSEMARGMHQYQQEIESGQRTLIGVNKFTLDKDESVIKLFKPDPEDQKRQIGRLNDVKKRRSESSVHNALGEIRRTAEEKARGRMINIIPPILDAVKEDATVGEIFAVLRDVFGEYQPSRKF
jgi:methylmalonyl-CoA mutase N-terminal domain/subunit